MQHSNTKESRPKYLYVTWYGMKLRCYNPNHASYKRYGARGIKVCDRWTGKDGFKNFTNDMGIKPTPKHTLNRIDNNGNYEPSNCEWADKWTQISNRRNTSPHQGVTYVKVNKSMNWWAYMMCDGTLVLSKGFNTYKEAIAARQAAELKYIGVILQPEAANLEMDTK